MKSKINWYWIFVGVFFISILFLASEVRSIRKELSKREKILDSLGKEVVLLKDEIGSGREEFDFLIRLGRDSFDKK